MYAVIKSGGKQYRVTQGQTLKIEKRDLEVGSKLEFAVLLVANGDKIEVGTPELKGHTVTAEVVSHGRGDKVKIVKMRRRKHHRKQMGHRQDYTEVKITTLS